MGMHQDATGAMVATVEAPVAAQPCRCAMTGHAINLLNNHAGVFGFGQDRETYNDQAPDATNSLPEDVRDALVDAMEAAAQFLTREFRGAR
jgi:hypothetical protein